MTLTRSCTHSSRKVAISGLIVPKSTSRSSVNGWRENLRMVSAGPWIARGGIIALTREPSGKRASTKGLLSSMRRPMGATMRSITWRRSASSRKATSMRSRRPSRSMKIFHGSFTMISVMVGSSSKGSSGPRPTIRSTTDRVRSSCCVWVRMRRSSSISRCNLPLNASRGGMVSRNPSSISASNSSESRRWRRSSISSIMLSDAFCSCFIQVAPTCIFHREDEVPSPTVEWSRCAITDKSLRPNPLTALPKVLRSSSVQGRPKFT